MQLGVVPRCVKSRDTALPVWQELPDYQGRDLSGDQPFGRWNVANFEWLQVTKVRNHSFSPVIRNLDLDVGGTARSVG
jgi:hypothetical protein